MKAVDKCNAMIQWFEGRKLPDSPLQLNPHTKLNDVPMFVERHIEAMKRIMPKVHLGIELNILRIVYLHLYELKKYIENHEKQK